MGHSTGLGDILNAYLLFNEDNIAQDRVKQQLAAQQALWEQQSRQNIGTLQNLGIGPETRNAPLITPSQITSIPNQQFSGTSPLSSLETTYARMGANPNFTKSIYPQLVSGSLSNQGAMQRHLTPDATRLATQPKFDSIQRTDSGLFQGVNQQGQAVNIPHGPGFTPEPKYHSPGTTVNVINRERTKLDEALGTAAGEEFIQYKQNYAGSKKVLDTVKNIDNLLQDQNTGTLAPLVLDAQKIISGFFPNAIFPKLSESIGKREAAEQLAIGNAMVELSKFKGPTTDFEFNKAMQRNPSLLITSAGRKKALMLLEKDANRAKQIYQQAVKARKDGTFDATFTPQEPRQQGQIINGYEVIAHPTDPSKVLRRKVQQ